MKAFVNRRELGFSLLALFAMKGRAQDPEAYARIFDVLWVAVRDRFYDPKTRKVDWESIRAEFRPQARTCTSDAQLLALMREMLRRLHNSHIFLYSREEWILRQNILPICFDSVAGRVFVRYPLQSKNSTMAGAIEFGDEILTVDGIPAEKLRPVTLARLEPIIGNPNFGPPGSVAEIKLRRGEQLKIVRAIRVTRPTGFNTAVVEFPLADIVHVRLFTLGSAELPTSQLKQIWHDVVRFQGLVLDLRNCVGGDSKVTNFIAGSFLGPGKPLFRTIPRPGTSEREVLDITDSEAPRFTGRVALITNSNTESQPEIMAAICKEYGCARLIGERTAGAFNGWTQAIELPDNFARFAVPYTRSVSPKKIEYEGYGVEPDTVAANTVADYKAKKDRVLITALQYIKA